MFIVVMIVGVEPSTMYGLYSVLDTVIISGEDECCSVVFVTLVGNSSSVMLSINSAVAHSMSCATTRCERW